MFSHLFPAIIRQGCPQYRGDVPEFFREALAGTRRIRPLHPGQDDQARRPLHQRADGRPRPCENRPAERVKSLHQRQCGSV